MLLRACLHTQETGAAAAAIWALQLKQQHDSTAAILSDVREIFYSAHCERQERKKGKKKGNPPSPIWISLARRARAIPSNNMEKIVFRRRFRHGMKI